MPRDGRLRRVVAAAGLVAACAAPAAGQQSSTPSSEPPVSLFGFVPGEPSSVHGASAVEQAGSVAVDPEHKPKRGEFVIAPMPMVNPTLENGLFAVVGYLYRLDPNDRTTPPSVTGVLGFKTSNGSWAGAVIQSLHLKHDLIRVLGLVAYSDINYAFYGIGQNAGNAGLSIELNQAGPAAMVEGLLRVRPRWYVGARYQILDMAVETSGVQVPGGPTLPGIDANIRTAALGPRFEYDSRENPFYPRQGTQIQGIASFYGKPVGGERTYQQYQGWVNRYHSLNARNVLAWHAGTCGVDGPVPFYDLCMLGKNQDLRGYPVGQYRDRAMVAAQAELRSELWWRVGATAFLGGGAIAPSFSKLSLGDTLPGGGAGLRFTLAKRNHVNLRVDYAWGRYGSSALYIGVAEAF